MTLRLIRLRGFPRPTRTPRNQSVNPVKDWARIGEVFWKQEEPASGCFLSSRATSSNEPFGSRPEPGGYLIVSILLLPPGEVPEGRARGLQDTATQVQSESEG
jgi:hypothetical protein